MYRAMRDVGMPDPRAVDMLELWEIAVLIGADGFERPDAPAAAHGERTRGRDHAHLRARLEARKQAGTDSADGSGSHLGDFTFHEAPADMASLELLTALGGGSF